MKSVGSSLARQSVGHQGAVWLSRVLYYQTLETN
jgi:hypothetical protein